MNRAKGRKVIFQIDERNLKELKAYKKCRNNFFKRKKIRAQSFPTGFVI
jgi:hypothetical protein